MNKTKTDPRIVALRDISEYMRKNNIKIKDKNNDVWIVTSHFMDNSKQRRLNRDLGIHKVNFKSIKMARFGKHKKQNE